MRQESEGSLIHDARRGIESVKGRLSLLILGSLHSALSWHNSHRRCVLEHLVSLDLDIGVLEDMKRRARMNVRREEDRLGRPELRKWCVAGGAVGFLLHDYLLPRSLLGHAVARALPVLVDLAPDLGTWHTLINMFGCFVLD